MGSALPGIYLRTEYQCHQQMDRFRNYDPLAFVSQRPCHSSWMELEEFEFCKKQNCERRAVQYGMSDIWYHRKQHLS